LEKQKICDYSNTTIYMQQKYWSWLKIDPL